METILKLLPHDKCLHLIAGIVIFIVGSVLINPLFGLAMTAIVGAWKELVYDYYNNNHTIDYKDFLYTVVGGLLGLLCSI